MVAVRTLGLTFAALVASTAPGAATICNASWIGIYAAPIQGGSLGRDCSVRAVVNGAMCPFGVNHPIHFTLRDAFGALIEARVIPSAAVQGGFGAIYTRRRLRWYTTYTVRASYWNNPGNQAHVVSNFYTCP